MQLEVKGRWIATQGRRMVIMINVRIYEPVITIPMCHIFRMQLLTT